MPANIFFNSIKNWDNKTWLSSLSYIRSFNKFLIKNAKINQTTKIIDVGCGRGKILGHLVNRLKLKNKPLGIDLENHKDRNKSFNFKKIDALKYFKKNRNTFDLILIKQTIHLFKITKIKKLLKLCKSKLNQDGKIIIITLDPYYNEIPTFSLMARQLKISLERDKKIVKLISRLYSARTTKKFSFSVIVSKKKYIEMIKNRYISILLQFSSKEILQGISELNFKFKKVIKFKDKLRCLVIKK